MQNRIITMLRQGQGFVSGEDLSRELGISRSAVWKQIEDLRSRGYEIEAVPHQGYRFLGAPDKLFPAEIRHGLGTRKFGCDIRHAETLPSTMDEAFRLGMEGAPEGVVVIAESQSRGRGRLGRAWVSPPGRGLYFSLLLRPSLSFAEAAGLTLLAAVGVSEGVEAATGVAPLIKWPNDLLLEGRKLAGILTELRGEMDRVSFAVVGIGLNVNTPRAALPPEGIALRETLGREISRAEVLRGILRSMEARYLSLRRKGFAPVFEEWRRRSTTLGRRVAVDITGRRSEGTAVDIGPDGGLLVRLDNGSLVKRMAGDIALL